MAENIKEALEYSVELAERAGKVIQVGDKHYYNANQFDLLEVNPRKIAPKLQLCTLDSLIDYLKSDNDAISASKKIIVVESPKDVIVYDQVDWEYGRRPQLVSVVAYTPGIRLNQWNNQEQFNIMLQSAFIDEDDRQVVLEFASALKVENGADIVDNGINQTTTVKSGVASLAKATAPNPVTLRPYRTFTEVAQPSSQFVLRINKDAELALFEADGGKWKLEAIKNIADYLKAGLEDQDNITILA